MTVSHIALGNQALKASDYERALTHYRQAQSSHPQLAHLLRANIAVAERRMGSAPSFEQHIQAAVATTIDVVVPVYNALEDVQRCLASLETHTDGFDVRIIVVNDGSDASTSHWLREHCASKPLFTLIEHPLNQGYTRAVNAGLKSSTAPYVITQNSDTIVAAGWLRGLVRTMESDPELGIVGPLSNAASWQNVPNLKDDSGSFAVNALPQGLDVDGMARLVAEVSERRYPRLPFVNGFCFMIRRAVIDAIGYMDEENFPVGYGEENDYCIRAADAGFQLAIADDVYVFHAKSKSFGHERRKELSARGTESLKRKHTPSKYFARVEGVKRTEVLDQVRLLVQAALAARSPSDPMDLMSMRILFLLPVKGGGGGAHSVVQEVTEMRRLGIHARVAVRHEQVDGFVKMYADIADAKETFEGFDDQTLLQVAEDYNVVVGTIFTSMRLVKRIVAAHPYILPAYYVQDYEPLFFQEGAPKWHEARESYTLVPGAFLFAKTQWIIDEVKRNHHVMVHKVQPSIDHEVYKPALRVQDGRLRVTAMIRPQTPHRGAERTMRLLARLNEAHGDRLSLHIFGCDGAYPDFQKLERDFPFQNHGPLVRPQVADLLAQSDLFIDLSDYQAFGRTALEAMACGCGAVVPAAGGAYEYAQHNKNALVLDSTDEAGCFEAVSRLLSTPVELLQLRRAGLTTAAKYSVHAAAISECLHIEQRLKEWAAKHPRIERPLLLLMPSLRADGLPTGSGYVRVVLPYQSPAVLKNWRVRQTAALPEPGSAHTVLIQREAIGQSLVDLQDWLPRWKAAGGKLVYEIDDDLLDADGLKARHHKGDVKVTAAKVRFLAGAADVVHVSTEPLAQRLRQFNANVCVIPNALDTELWQLDRPRRHDQGAYRRCPEGPVRIGYIGTPTHDDDLDLVADAMRAIQKKYGDGVEIEVIGGFQNRAPTFGKRVGLPKKNDYPNFVRWLQERVHWDIGIIPLVDNKFNESKSYLKFLEYAALDMAIVVSDVATYRPILEHDANALAVAPSLDDWIGALSKLIESPALRRELSQRASRDAYTCHTLSEAGPSIGASLSMLYMERR